MPNKTNLNEDIQRIKQSLTKIFYEIFTQFCKRSPIRNERLGKTIVIRYTPVTSEVRQLNIRKRYSVGRLFVCSTVETLNVMS